jgi:hypothetical protein
LDEEILDVRPLDRGGNRAPAASVPGCAP